MLFVFFPLGLETRCAHRRPSTHPRCTGWLTHPCFPAVTLPPQRWRLEAAASPVILTCIFTEFPLASPLATARYTAVCTVYLIGFACSAMAVVTATLHAVRHACLLSLCGHVCRMYADGCLRSDVAARSTSCRPRVLRPPPQPAVYKKNHKKNSTLCWAISHVLQSAVPSRRVATPRG